MFSTGERYYYIHPSSLHEKRVSVHFADQNILLTSTVREAADLPVHPESCLARLLLISSRKGDDDLLCGITMEARWAPRVI